MGAPGLDSYKDNALHLSTAFEVPADHVAVNIGDAGSASSISDVAVPTPPDKEQSLPEEPQPAALLEPVPSEQRVTVSCIAVNAWVPAFFAPPSTLDKLRKSLQQCGGKEQVQAPAERQILFNINVACQPGEVLALMGPSGGGKTSLLSVIGGRTPKLVRLEGDVLYNEVHLTKERKRSVGYVLQDDLLHESLTVYETLYFAAMLRLPKTMSKAQKLQRVNAVIDSLGLSKCQNTIIGGFFRRGVSGGERKRVSVGHELLINPSVLLLDEPTSGLDSTTAMHLLLTLRQLAQGGRSICTTIHQPSSRLYQQLDSLLLLSQGHALYYGDAADVVSWFEGLGCTQPMGVNTGDWILDLASGEVTSPQLGKDGEESRLGLIAAADKFLVDNPGGYTKSHIKRYFSSKDTMARANSKLEKKQSSMQRLNSWTQNALTVKDRWGAPYLKQISILFTRAVKTRRFETLSVQDFAQFILVGVMAGLFWWQVGRNNTLLAASDSYGLLFFEGLFLAFRIMFSALFTFPNEFKMMLKERASGMYRLSAFYFARTLSDIPMDMFIPSIFVIIIYWMAWLRPTAGAFFANWMCVLLVQFTAQGFGLVIGAAVMNPKTAQTIAAVIMLVFMLISGYYVRNVPVWVDWMKYLSFLWYGFTLLSKIEFQGRTFYDCNGLEPPNPESDPSCRAITGAALSDALRVARNVDEWPWEVVVLLGYCIILRVVVYICLRVKTGNV